MERLNIGVDAARKKIQHFCAYQERCHSEVKNKLFEMGLYPREVDELLAELVKENYLNEERFAVAFAGGKFRMKNWGRLKIKKELKSRLVSEYCIRKGLQQINDEEYNTTLDKIAEKKVVALTGNRFQKKGKLTRYLLQKGFEMDLVLPVAEKYID